MIDESERLRRRAERERRARKEAEAVLEQRSRQLWEANQALQTVRSELEQRVEARTAELAAALERAREADASKTRFLAHVTHELRTPLTSILGFTADLRSEWPDNEDLATVHRNARHLLELINELLDLAHVESGTLVVSPAPTDLRAMVSDAARTIESRARAKGLTFRASVDDALPDAVEIDGTRVRQILLNFLANAVKFTDRGAVGLRVYPVGPSRPEHIRFDVLDTGRGIPPDAVDGIFEAFQQAQTGDRVRGTGLGLTIAKRLAETMGGSVGVQSAVGRGSCFRLELPAPACPDRIDRADTMETDLDPRPLQGLHIVLAEDADDSRRLLERWCTRAGGVVVGVGDGRRAVDAAVAGADIVVMDVQMPVLDGCDATRKLRDLGFDRPIVALTASTDEGERQACLDAGCDAVLHKPIGRTELLAVLGRLA
jgi:signal transduction histidine kinase